MMQGPINIRFKRNVSPERKTRDWLIVCGLVCCFGCVNMPNALFTLESLFLPRNCYNMGSVYHLTKGSCYIYIVIYVMQGDT